jgi:hypothetical protein
LNKMHPRMQHRGLRGALRNLRGGGLSRILKKSKFRLLINLKG